MEGVREVNSTHFLVLVSSMTLTVVRDILLDSDIVLLIQDISSRNGLFTTEICAIVAFSFLFL